MQEIERFAPVSAEKILTWLIAYSHGLSFRDNNKFQRFEERGSAPLTHVYVVHDPEWQAFFREATRCDQIPVIQRANAVESQPSIQSPEERQRQENESGS
jgi:hypothetical protein